MAQITHEELESQMLELIEDVCGDSDATADRDADLFAEGFLDSMAAVELLVEIEDTFGVTIAPTEVPREEMNTVNLIIHQVETRLQKAGKEA